MCILENYFNNRVGENGSLTLYPKIIPCLMQDIMYFNVPFESLLLSNKKC
jgi:hypothetical protein